MKQIHKIIAVAVIVLIAAACGKKKEQIERISLPEVTTLLAAGSDSSGIERISEVATVGPGQIEDYAGVRAAGYLAFDFVGLGTTTYETDGIEVSVEVAQFGRSLDAFGFYSFQRPSGAAQQGIGAASFSLGAGTHFTNGIFEVVLVTKTEEDEAYGARLVVASMIDGLIAERSSRPPIYMLFPYGDQIRPSSRFIAHDFLGAEGLEDVYTVEYFIGDTVVLFLTKDIGGTEFQLLRKAAADIGKVEGASPTIVAEAVDGQAFEFSHPEHGRVVAAQVGKYFVGALRYENEIHEVLLSRWMLGLQF